MILKTKNEILNWLKQYDKEYQQNIKNQAYELIDIHDDMNQSLLYEMMKKDRLVEDYFEKLKSEGHQYILNVIKGIDISENELKMIPIQFYHVDGFYDCAHNQLTSLKGCPQIIIENFYCDYNQLKSLQGCPKIVGSMFSCSNNQLSSLESGHFAVKGDFNCSNNQLTSLKGCPQNIHGHFDCFSNQLTSLKHSPIEVHGIFNCSGNQINSLKGCPQSIASHFSCEHNQLISLEYAPQSISGDLLCSHNYIKTLNYFPEKVDGLIFLENNQELLKYKNQSTDIFIQNMTDDVFLSQRGFSFWQYFYLQEKIEKENKKMMDDLNLDELKEKNHLVQPRVRKV